jgi:hypothetical protein
VIDLIRQADLAVVTAAISAMNTMAWRLPPRSAESDNIDPCTAKNYSMDTTIAAGAIAGPLADAIPARKPGPATGKLVKTPGRDARHAGDRRVVAPDTPSRVAARCSRVRRHASPALARQALPRRGAIAALPDGLGHARLRLPGGVGAAAAPSPG